MAVAIPDSHRDLLDNPVHAVFTTMMADGQPQSTLVWCDCDGGLVRVNTVRESQKARNLLRNPRATILIVDVTDASRWIEIRGTVTLSTDGADEHLHKLTRDYTTYSTFYGAVVPLARQALETRVICNLEPARITLDAIHR